MDRTKIISIRNYCIGNIMPRQSIGEQEANDLKDNLNQDEAMDVALASSGLPIFLNRVHATTQMWTWYLVLLCGVQRYLRSEIQGAIHAKSFEITVGTPSPRPWNCHLVESTYTVWTFS